MDRCFRLTVAYDGTDYSGWQVQPGQRTVQGQLEQAFAKLTGTRIRITGSGRTDSGVHGLGQVASLTTDAWRDSSGALCRAMNTKLSEDVAVVEAAEMPLGFHAIRDAIAKRYRYQIRVGGVRDPLQHRYRVHHPGPLAIESMRLAAQKFIGEKDFASFQATGGKTKTTVRHVHDLQIKEISHRKEWIDLDIEIEANGFLYNMVRNIVGSLLEVGRGKHPPSWIDQVFSARDRDQAGKTAPPQGLFLVEVKYPIQPLAS